MADPNTVKARRALHAARRPLTSFTQVSSKGRVISSNMIHSVPEASQKELVYALPETITVGQDVFSTQWWMDPYNHAPISITRKAVNPWKSK